MKGWKVVESSRNIWKRCKVAGDGGVGCMPEEAHGVHTEGVDFLLPLPHRPPPANSNPQDWRLIFWKASTLGIGI